MDPTEIDMALRDAIYFEAVKEYEADEASSFTDEAIAVLLALLLRRGYTSFAEITKRDMNALIVDARKALNAQLEKGSETFLARMQNILAYTLPVTLAVYAKATRKAIPKEFAATATNLKRLWASIVKDPIPAAGVSMGEMVKDLGRALVTQMSVALKRAYADNWTLTDLTNFLKGTPAKNFKDGALNKLSNQAKTVARTSMAQIKSWLSYNVGRVFYPTYQWISTIDSVTTDVCRSRHLRIYEYGTGPRPPAHFNCRSIIVGMVGDLSNMVPRSYWDWIRSQPGAFLRDVLLPGQAAAINDGTARAPEFPVFRNVRRLTPEQYGQRVTSITT